MQISSRVCSGSDRRLNQRYGGIGDGEETRGIFWDGERDAIEGVEDGEMFSEGDGNAIECSRARAEDWEIFWCVSLVDGSMKATEWLEIVPDRVKNEYYDQ